MKRNFALFCFVATQRFETAATKVPKRRFGSFGQFVVEDESSNGIIFLNGRNLFLFKSRQLTSANGWNSIRGKDVGKNRRAKIGRKKRIEQLGLCLVFVRLISFLLPSEVCSAYEWAIRQPRVYRDDSCVLVSPRGDDQHGP